MLPPWLSRPARLAPKIAVWNGAVALAAALLTAVVLLPAGPAPAAEVSATHLNPVSYRGYTFAVPAGWPVINLATHPGACVRFDLHAVYLGTPGANEACPSWLLGSTEALVIQPAAGHVRRMSTENPVSHQITVRAPRISVIGTFDAEPDGHLPRTGKRGVAGADD